MTIKTPKELVFMHQHGVDFLKETDTQAVADCPFCNASEKFYANKEKKTFDCKVCGVKGGYQTFLRRVLEECSEVTKTNKNFLKPLAEEKSLNIDVLKKLGVVFNPVSNAFLVPIVSADKKTVQDLRIYKDKKTLSTSGCNVGLWGWEDLNDFDKVFICEGEWDKVAMHQLLDSHKWGGEVCVVAVTGANIFKQEWASLFRGKEVYCFYDNDKAGREGANKAHNVLSTVASKVLYLHWNEGTVEKFDVRDFMKEGKTLEVLLGMMEVEPPQGEGAEGTASVFKKKKDPLTELKGEFISPAEVYATYKKWLHLPDTDVLDVMYGTCIANRLEGDPLWLFLVAPSGGTKTEIINTISEAPLTVTTSSLTPKSLVSGANIGGGGDPSLIPKLDGKILIVKDFTTILNMAQIQREEIFGILRDAYDGKTEKDFGNGLHRSYKSKFGFVGAVTPAIEIFSEGNTSLGERFLRYNIPIPDSAKDRDEYIKRAVSNTGHEIAMREELSKIGQRVLSHNFKTLPIINEDHQTRIRALAQFVAKMRGTVIRDKFTKEVTHNAFPELGTRLVKQFTKLALGVGMFRGLEKITAEEFNIVQHLCLSTIPQRLLSAFLLFKDGEELMNEECTKLLHLPSNTVSRMTEDLVQLGLLERVQVSAMKVTFKLSEDGNFFIQQKVLEKDYSNQEKGFKKFAKRGDAK